MAAPMFAARRSRASRRVLLSTHADPIGDRQYDQENDKYKRRRDSQQQYGTQHGLLVLRIFAVRHGGRRCRARQVDNFGQQIVIYSPVIEGTGFDVLAQIAIRERPCG